MIWRKAIWLLPLPPLLLSILELFQIELSLIMSPCAADNLISGNSDQFLQRVHSILVHNHMSATWEPGRGLVTNCIGILWLKWPLRVALGAWTKNHWLHCSQRTGRSIDSIQVLKGKALKQTGVCLWLPITFSCPFLLMLLLERAVHIIKSPPQTRRWVKKWLRYSFP